MKTKEGRSELMKIFKRYDIKLKDWLNMSENEQFDLIFDYARKNEEEYDREMKREREWAEKQARADKREAEERGFESVGDYLDWCEEQNERYWEMYGY